MDGRSIGDRLDAIETVIELQFDSPKKGGWSQKVGGTNWENLVSSGGECRKIESVSKCITQFFVVDWIGYSNLREAMRSTRSLASWLGGGSCRWTFKLERFQRPRHMPALFLQKIIVLGQRRPGVCIDSALDSLVLCNRSGIGFVVSRKPSHCWI
jgi:hypothetical protein